MTDTYNGYHNYPTWVIGLWLTSDEGSYDVLISMVNEAVDTFDLADKIKGMTEEEAPDLSGVYSDLLAWAIGQADYYELATLYWDDFRTEKSNDEEE